MTSRRTVACGLASPRLADIRQGMRDDRRITASRASATARSPREMLSGA